MLSMTSAQQTTTTSALSLEGETDDLLAVVADLRNLDPAAPAVFVDTADEPVAIVGYYDDTPLTADDAIAELLAVIEAR